jgi:hypothetical protein
MITVASRHTLSLFQCVSYSLAQISPDRPGGLCLFETILADL